MSAERMPVGVFVGGSLAGKLERVTDLGLSVVQHSAPWADGCTEEAARANRDGFAGAGITVSLVFCGFPGERYDSIPIVRETVGLVPDATRAERLEQTKRIADYAAWMGAPGIGIHIGFVSEDTASPEFASICETVGEVCDHCAGRDLTMNLETGQETADTLLALLQTVDRENLRVNFDPANMILYGSGEPLEALRKVGRYVSSVHCKDATWSDRPGETFGEEVPLGEGDVNMREFVSILNELGYDGPLTIEREVSGERQIEGIRVGVERLNQIKRELAIT